MLSSGKSFRSSQLQEIIQHNMPSLSISGSIKQENTLHLVGIEKTKNGATRLKIDANTAKSTAEIAELIPLQLMTPHGFHLIETGPDLKRKYLDWGVFHVEHHFIEYWRNFKKALKQRNALLKSFRAPNEEIKLWDIELANAAVPITEMRQAFSMLLFPIVEAVAEDLIGIKGIKLKFMPGWETEKKYLALLEENQKTDKHSGFTQLGPHRADIKIEINRNSAQEVLSRGQQKLLVCAMSIAQGIVLKNKTGKQCIYLIDDIVSELDECNRKKALALLATLGMQVFASCIDKESLESLGLPYTLFHVEHGIIKKEGIKSPENKAVETIP